MTNYFFPPEYQVYEALPNSRPSYREFDITTPAIPPTITTPSPTSFPYSQLRPSKQQLLGRVPLVAADVRLQAAEEVPAFRQVVLRAARVHWLPLWVCFRATLMPSSQRNRASLLGSVFRENTSTQITDKHALKQTSADKVLRKRQAFSYAKGKNGARYDAPAIAQVALMLAASIVGMSPEQVKRFYGSGNGYGTIYLKIQPTDLD